MNCVALFCPAVIPSNKLACSKHWAMMTPELRRAIFNSYMGKGYWSDGMRALVIRAQRYCASKEGLNANG